MRRSVTVGLLLLLAVVTTALATQVMYLTPGQLGAESELVVQGKVTGVSSYWNAEKTRIFTEARVRVDSAFKGSSTGEIRVLQPGGVVGNVRMTVHGALAWKNGEEVVLFLEPSFPGTWQVSGFSQGKFIVERDSQTGAGYVTRPADADAELVGAPDGGPTPMTSNERVPVRRFVDDALGRR